MQLSPALSSDLTLLTQALGPSRGDIGETLHQLAVDARLAVHSYLGLTLVLTGDTPFAFTALEDGARAEDIRSSLLIPIPHVGSRRPGPATRLVLYAGRAGAFVDLAADLAWLTGIAPSDYALDQHLSTISHPYTAPSVHDTSVINQAIGVLIGRGHLPEDASAQLDAPTGDGTTNRYASAVQILSSLTTDTGPTNTQDDHGSYDDDR